MRAPTFHFGLSQAEGLFRDDRRHAALNHYIVIPILTDVLSVLDNSVDAVLVEEVSLRGTKATGVQVVAYRSI